MHCRPKWAYNVVISALVYSQRSYEVGYAGSVCLTQGHPAGFHAEWGFEPGSNHCATGVYKNTGILFDLFCLTISKNIRTGILDQVFWSI